MIFNLRSNLLGFPAIWNLHLIKRVDLVNAADSIKQGSVKVFEGLGTLRGVQNQAQREHSSLLPVHAEKRPRRESERVAQADGSYGSDL